MRRLLTVLILSLFTATPAFSQLYNTAGNGGTATNDNACAGCVGEVIESVIALNTTQSLTTNTALNVTQISLTAGDWDVRGTAVFKCAVTTTVNSFTVSLSDTTATVQSAPVSRTASIAYSASTVHSTAVNSFVPVGPTRFSLATTTPVYLVAASNFATSTCQTNGGHIAARRAR